MESLGILAGGIAHDFNNLLQAIIGFSDVAIQETDLERIRSSIGEIRSASLRGAQLTRQILTFSRRQPLELSTLQVTELLASFVPTLHRLVRPGIRIRNSFDQGLPCIEADAVQLEQVIMNLVTNACDAMPNEGIIDLQTSLVPQTLAPIAGSGDSRLRDAIALTVRDNGQGMPPETLARIFEPFFTTKARSRGTGLGLAVVHGIVKQHGGEIRVKSKPGVGTEFTVLIPVSTKRALSSKTPPRPAFNASGQWALLAEDEPFLRSLDQGMLKRLGFQVIIARDGTEALELFRNHAGTPFSVFVFDVMLPRRTGIEAYREMLHCDNCPPVVFVSGYPGDLPTEPMLRQRSRFLRKPFREQELADEIQRCMELVAKL